MNIFNWIFNQKISASPLHDKKGSVENLIVTRDGTSVIEIPSLDLIGAKANSPDGHWILAWGEVVGSGSPSSQVVLIQDNHIVLKDRFAKRPESGSVANDGTFTIVDESGSNLSGIFLVINSSGKIIIKQKVHSNICASGISADGRLCGFHACENKGSVDHLRVAIMECDTQKLVASFQSETRPSNGLSIDPDTKRVFLWYFGMNNYAYSFEGDFLDRMAWLLDAMRLDRPREAIEAGFSWVKLITPLDSAAVKPLYEAAERVLQTSDVDRNPKLKALALKLQATAKHIEGEPEEALKIYQEAYVLDPNCGVKKRMVEIEKFLAFGSDET